MHRDLDVRARHVGVRRELDQIRSGSRLVENSTETIVGTPRSFPQPIPSPSLWYKDAVIYQVHVRGFFDSDDDGVGDFAGPDAQARLHPVARRLVHLAAAVLPVAAPRRRLRHRALRRRPQVVRHAEGLPDVSRRSARARAARHHRARHQPHVRPASLVPGGAPGAGRDRASATSTSGATPIRSTRASASSSATRSDRTGRGIRSRARTTGTGSSTTSRI